MSFKIQDCDGGIGSGEHLKSYNTICGGLAIKKRLKTSGISFQLSNLLPDSQFCDYLLGYHHSPILFLMLLYHGIIRVQIGVIAN